MKKWEDKAERGHKKSAKNTAKNVVAENGSSSVSMCLVAVSVVVASLCLFPAVYVDR
jgi:hypothetical protein